MILLGFKYLASSIPIICLSGVAIGVGIVFSELISSISRNSFIINQFIRWTFIGFSLVEVSGFIGLVFSFLILYALIVVVAHSGPHSFLHFFLTLIIRQCDLEPCYCVCGGWSLNYACLNILIL